MTIWLSRMQLIGLQGELIRETGGEAGIRDVGLLQSALVAPLQTFDNKELHPTIIEKAARLAYGLTKFHPFVDGNKRIGAHALAVVLELNKISISYEQKELSDLFLQLAAGDAEYEDLVEWVHAHLNKI